MTEKNGKSHVRSGETAGFRLKEDTPDNVFIKVRRKAWKMAGTAPQRKQKKSKKICKTPGKTIAMEKGFMYNPSVVCLGMKW